MVFSKNKQKSSKICHILRKTWNDILYLVTQKIIPGKCILVPFFATFGGLLFNYEVYCPWRIRLKRKKYWNPNCKQTAEKCKQTLFYSSSLWPNVLRSCDWLCSFYGWNYAGWTKLCCFTHYYRWWHFRYFFKKVKLWGTDFNPIWFFPPNLHAMFTMIDILSCQIWIKLKYCPFKIAKNLPF